LDGHQKLVALFGRCRPARLCLEATGLYGLDIALALHEAGLEVMVANPRAARRFMEAQMTRAKSDKVDARGLLAFVERMEFIRWTPPSAARLTLRMLARRIHDLTLLATAEKNRLHAVQATSATPEFVLEDLRSGLAQLDERLTALIAKTVEYMLGNSELAPAYRALVTVKGIKERAAIGILGELMVLPADMTPKQVVAHAGLDPRPNESGTSVRGRNPISKVGNSRLRGALYLPALTASQHQPGVSDHYQRLMAAKKLPRVALVAVMRKLLQSAWRMIQTGAPFDPEKYGPKPAVAP
jgi:transposase